ncbi:hypothetical protein ABK040_008397 [Willaertia magna]
MNKKKTSGWFESMNGTIMPSKPKPIEGLTNKKSLLKGLQSAISDRKKEKQEESISSNNKLNNKSNSIIQKEKESKKSIVTNNNEENFEKSKKKLEEKAKLYEKIMNGECNYDKDLEDRLLVDFDRKIDKQTSYELNTISNKYNNSKRMNLRNDLFNNDYENEEFKEQIRIINEETNKEREEIDKIKKQRKMRKDYRIEITKEKAIKDGYKKNILQ